MLCANRQRLRLSTTLAQDPRGLLCEWEGPRRLVGEELVELAERFIQNVLLKLLVVDHTLFR